MKKRNNPKKIDCVPIQNPVAKFAHQFNKALIFVNKNKYQRNAKHRKQEASLIILSRIIREAFYYPTIILINNQNEFDSLPLRV